MAAAATAVGFFSFVPTDYVGVSNLGLIAGVGMLIALAFNMTLLPALLTLLRPRGEARAVGFARLAPFNRMLVERRGVVLVLAALVAVAAATLIPALRFDFNPLDLQSQRTEAMQVLNELKSDPNDTPNTAEILAPSIDAATALAGRLDKLPEVAQTVTAASFVPEDQQAKLAILADTAAVLGITLSPPETKTPPSDAEILAAIAACAKDMSEARRAWRRGGAPSCGLLQQVAARGAAVLPALQDNLAAGLPRRLDDLKQSLAAEPVSLATLPEEIKRDWITQDGKARVEVFPRAARPTTIRCGASSRPSSPSRPMRPARRSRSRIPPIP